MNDGRERSRRYFRSESVCFARIARPYETIFLAAWRFRRAVYLSARGNSPFHGLRGA
jgi:hypothetical protein